MSSGGDGGLLIVILVIGLAIATIIIIVVLYNLASLEYMASDMGKALNMKNYQKVIDLGLRYLKKKGADFWIYYYMAHAHEGLYQYYRAIEYYEKSLIELQKNPRREMKIEILLKLGRFSRNIKKPEQAIGYFDMILKEFPSNSSALLNMAEVLYELKRYIKVKECLEAFILIKPKHMDARFLLAKTYHILKEYQKSANQLDEWMKIKADTSVPMSLYNESLTLLGENYYQLKRYPDAIRILRPLLDDSELCGKVLYKIVSAYYKSNDYDLAIRIANDFLYKIPKNDRCPVLYELGQAYLFSGDIYKALDNWQSAYEMNPGYQDVEAILSRYNVLRKNLLLQPYFTTSDSEFEDNMIRRFKLKADNILEKNKEFWVMKDSSYCYILYRSPYSITAITLEKMDSIIARQGLSSMTINLYSLFGVDESSKGYSFYKRINEVANEAFVAFFTSMDIQ